MASSSSSSQGTRDERSTRNEQNPREGLVFNPSIWQRPMAPPGLGSAAVADGRVQQPAGYQAGVNVGYQAANNNIRPPPGLGGRVGGQDRQVVGFADQRPRPQPQNVHGLPPRPPVNSFVQQPPQQGYSVMGGRPGPMNMNNTYQRPPSQTDFGRQTPRPSQGFVQTPALPPSGFYQDLQGNNGFRPQRDVGRTAYPPTRAGVQAGGEGESIGGIPLYDPNFNFSDNYRGSRQAHQNRSANVRDLDNCSVFIRGLPPTCTPNMLLEQIRGCGSKIWALYINEPDARNPNNCAAKLVFFQRCGVDWLFAQIRAGLWVIIDESGYQYTPNAVYNNIRSAPMAVTDNRSRVLVVSGPPSVVSLENLDAIFKSKFFYEADCAFTLYEDANWRKIQFQFSSARCQSDNGKQLLEDLATQGPVALGL